MTGLSSIIGGLLCAMGLHSYGTVWSNIAPPSGGGPCVVRRRCRRCFHETLTSNSR